MSYAIIGGTTYDTEAGSLHIESAIGRRSTSAFTVKTDAPSIFLEDTAVALYDQNGARIFAGYLVAPKHGPAQAMQLYHALSACDKHRLADKRAVVGSWVGYTGAYIARYVVTTFLAAEGVTIGAIYDDHTIGDDRIISDSLLCGEAVGVISALAADYCMASVTFDEIVKRISASGIPFYWQIDYGAAFFLVPYDAIESTLTIDESVVEEIEVPPQITRTNPKYRNTQIVKGGYVETVVQNETFTGDGNAQSWPMRFALSQTPTITVNGVTKTVGIRGVESGKDFYWSKGEFDITQDAGAPKLIGTDAGACAYIGMYKNVSIVQDTTQIALEAGIDGTSGQVDAVEDVATTSLSAQLQVAGSRLTRYAVQSPPGLEFSTMQVGFVPGEWVPVQLPDFSLSLSMLIESVEASDALDGLNVWYRVKAISGPSDTTWAAFWGELTGSGNVASTEDTATTTIVTVSQSFSLGISLAVSFTYSTFACPLCSNTTLCSDSTIIC